MVGHRSGLLIAGMALAVVAGAQTARAASPDPLYFNSSEPGCDGSDPNVLFCDDFEDRTWYASDAGTSGGWLSPANSGWAGTTTANPITPAGAAVCSNQGAAGTNCAATHGQTSGATGGRNMADHNFVNDQGVDELYVRYYTKPETGYQFGAERVLAFNDGLPGGGGIKYGNLQFNCGATGPSSAGNLQIQLPAPENVCTPITTLQSGRWYYIETHIKLNTPGQADGVLEVWVNDCGADGVCADSPILQLQRADVRYNRQSTGELLRVLWWQNWASPGSIGTRLVDQIKVSTAGPVGFVGSAVTATVGATTSSAGSGALAAAAPAAISNIAAGSVTASQALITWTTSVPADSLVEYGTTAAYGSAAGDGALTTQHGVTLTGLAPGTLYHYRVQSSDAAGSLAMSGDQTFTTSGAVALSAMAAATPGYSVSASPAQTATGGTISVSWTAPAGQAGSGDWLGVYVSGAPNEDYLGFQYTGGSDSGATAFTLPGEPGTYEIRYLLDNGYTAAASSNPVTASGTGSSGGGSGGTAGGGGGSIAGFALTASPSNVAPGDPVTITWTAPAGQASIYDWIALFAQGAPNTSYLSYLYADGATAGTIVLTAPDTDGVYEARYLLNNDYTDAVTSNPVTVGAGGGSSGGSGGGVPTASLTLNANPTTITLGTQSSLLWSGTGLSSCAATGGWSGDKPTSGTQSVFPSATTTYGLVCQAADGGTVTQSATVTVGAGGGGTAQPSLAFAANPVSLTVGAQAVLTWTGNELTGCAASDGWTGDKAAAGTQIVTPPATTTYTLACQTTAGSSLTQSATITVIPAGGSDFSVSVSPSTVPFPGGQTTVSWTAPSGGAITLDLIVLLPVGANDTDPPAGLIPTGGSLSGSAIFSMLPALGTYEFRFMRNGVQQAISNPMTVVDGLGPAAELLSPADGDLVKMTIQLEGFASDFFGISGVQFRVDGTPLSGTVTPAGSDTYVTSWDTRTVPDGDHVLTFAAQDVSGNQTESDPIVVRVQNDTIPPTVAIVTPADGATIKRTVTVSVNATDNVGVVRVDIALDGAIVLTLTAPPYQYVWDTLSVADGPHTVSATAADLAGNTTTKTATVAVKNIDTTPPTVAVTSPADGATVSGSVTVSASASDDDVLAGVRFSVDGFDIGEDTTAPYTATWDSDSSGAGAHAVSAVATDLGGNQATSTVNVTVAGSSGGGSGGGGSSGGGGGTPTGYTLSASPSTVSAGGTITVNWTTIGGSANTSDWIGLYPAGAGGSEYLAYEYLPASSSGTLTFAAPGTNGTYEVRYLPNADYISVATDTVTVTGGSDGGVSGGGGTGGGGGSGGGSGGTPTGYAVSASPSTVSEGGTVTVSWSTTGGAATSADWIGLYFAGASNNAYQAYNYVTGGTSGTVTFTAPGPGNFEVRFLPNADYISVASDTFTVSGGSTGGGGGGDPAPAPAPAGGTPTGYTLSASPSTVSAGGTITVNWTTIGGSASSTDWIGLFAVGDGNNSYVEYQYVNAGTSGTVALRAPGSGTYECRYLPDNGYVSTASSAPITVN